MAKINRTLLYRGPALVTYDPTGTPAYFYSDGDINLSLGLAFGDIVSDAYGPVDRFRKSTLPTVTFEDAGHVRSLSAINPYASAVFGSSILNAGVDKQLLIQPLDTTQQQITFTSCALTKIPPLSLTSQNTVLRQMEFSLFPKNNTDFANANLRYTYASNTLSGTQFDNTKLYVQPYLASWLQNIVAPSFTLTYGANTTTSLVVGTVTAGTLNTAFNLLASVTSAGGCTVTGDPYNGFTVTWTNTTSKTAITGVLTGGLTGQSVLSEVFVAGGSVSEIDIITFPPFGSMTTLAGWQIAFNLGITQITNDAGGIIDAVFSSLSCTATAVLQGVKDSELLNVIGLQGAGSLPGKRLSTTGAHLYFQPYSGGSAFYFALYGANITKADVAYSPTKDRVQSVEFTATRTVTGGAVNPLYALSLTPIAGF